MIKPSPSIEYSQDSHLYVEREVAIGKRLVIIGEAKSGDLYNPVLVYGKEMAVDFFDSGPLVQSYEDATTYQEGLEIYLLRIEPLQYETAFAVLEALSFDLLYINDVSFKDDKAIFEKILEFTKIKQEIGNLVHVITTLPSGMNFSELSSLFDSIQDLTQENGDDPFETGKYLSLVVNQMTLKDTGAVYAGMLVTLNPETSPINKTIPNVSLELEFSKEEILKLREVGIVAFKNTFKNGVTCTSSSCAVSTAGSVHKHICNFRIAQSLINQVSLELQPFIGTTNLRFQSISIEEIIIAICEEFIGLSRIRQYDYHLSVNEQLGYIEVEMEIVPIFSVHGMTTHSRVRVFK
jgi:hypothetical protein